MFDFELVKLFSDNVPYFVGYGVGDGPLSESYRIVYGGDVTVLISRIIPKCRIALVRREKGVKNDLEKAVLYLLLKRKQIGGNEFWKTYVDDYWVGYDVRKKVDISDPVVQNKIYRMILNMNLFPGIMKTEDFVWDHIFALFRDSKDLETALLRLACGTNKYDQDEIDELINNATCSEKEKTILRKAKKKVKKVK